MYCSKATHNPPLTFQKKKYKLCFGRCSNELSISYYLQEVGFPISSSNIHCSTIGVMILVVLLTAAIIE
ncbi:hypothetical protein HI914_06662 [Erysiphe necator]|nr:hypothetical protein HI914_06662 [Erysiphe necator]